MPPFLASLLTTERGRKLVGFGTLAIGLIVLVGLIMLLQQCSIDERVEQGVKIDRADAVAEAAERIRASDAAVAMNQAQRADVLINQEGEFRDEAKKGDDRGVGPGVAGVLERMRSQQAAR